MKRLSLVLLLHVLVVFAVYAQEQLNVTKQDAEREQRIALVIGNGAYTYSPLPNPVNDARDMAAILKERRFQVIYQENVTKIEMKKAIRIFGERIQKGGVGLFYFAGHGIQVNGKNYLIPVGVTIDHEYEVEDESVDLEFLLGQMAHAQNQLNIVILDACRNNPFARSFRSNARGLAYVAAPSGTIIAYATAPGDAASDGSRRNSPYTEELLKYVRETGLRIEDIFKRVRLAVQKKTGGRQIPWESSSLVGDFYFTPTLIASSASAPNPTILTPGAGIAINPKKTDAIVPETSSTRGKLEDKANPLLIGKRNINKRQINFYSLDKEVALGRKMATETDKQGKFIEDTVVADYINRLGQNLALHSDAKVHFTIKVMDSDDASAFALPGGFLYVNNGLILAANNEAELASVIAHAIAHVAARHGVEQASKANPFGSSPKFPDVVLQFSTDKEIEADMLGAQYAWAAGYDPNYLITFFERVSKQEKPEAASNLHRTHILTPERITKLHTLTAQFPIRGENILNTPDFQTVQDKLRTRTNH